MLVEKLGPKHGGRRRLICVRDRHQICRRYVWRAIRGLGQASLTADGLTLFKDKHRNSAEGELSAGIRTALTPAIWRRGLHALWL